jgi:hypothetical protein
VKPDLVAPSPLWQTIFLSFAGILLLLQILRGWHLGLPRQLVRIGALVAAYATALYGGGVAVPWLRPLIKVPDFIISAIAGVILATIVYSVINTVGTILFKRTGQQESGIVRLVYGFSGAFLGLFFGLFFIWLMLVGIRSLGAIAEAQINASAPSRVPRFEERAGARPSGPMRRTPAEVPQQDSFAMALARLKKSVEFGSFGEVVKQTDVLPGGGYETLGKVGEVFAKPERAARFLSYPGIVELADNPQILALRADPEIARLLEEGRLWTLLQDERLIDVANDPELRRQIKAIDFNAALDHALRQE